MSTNRFPVITLSDQQLVLLPKKALYWKAAATLIVADLHLGKGSAVRAAGIPVPPGSTEETLQRLDRAIDATAADRLIILGDMLHHRDGDTDALERFAAWQKRRPLSEILLVAGNHDRLAALSAVSGIRVAEAAASEPPFVWSHLPEPHSGGYTLAGHLHPGVRLNGPGRQSLKLPCFHFTKSVGILPAFGEFTGLSLIRPVSGDRVFVIAGDEVIEKTLDRKASRSL